MKKSLKVLSLLISTVMAIAVFSGCTKKTSGGADGVINIGAVLPLTGPIATFGESSRKALLLFEEQVNEKGGVLGKKIKFHFEDDENKPANSANLAQKLIDENKVVGLIGSVASSCSIAMGPIATQNKIPMITGTSTNPAVTTTGGEYVFRACFIDPFQGTVVAKFALDELKATKAAILYDNGNDYTVGLAEFFEKGFKAGGTVLASERYNTGDTDFRAQLTRIKALEPEVLFLPDYYSTVGLITKQAKELGIEAVFLGADGWDSAELYSIAGDSINGGYFSNHYSPDDDSPEVQNFLADFAKKYNNEVPDALAVLAYDAATLMIEAIKKANSSEPEAIKNALIGMEATLVSGTVKIDADRNPVKSAVILQVNDGKFDFVKKVNP
jgi:branched-chain amino acid transport system substrate-binding protein